MDLEKRAITSRPQREQSAYSAVCRMCHRADCEQPGKHQEQGLCPAYASPARLQSELAQPEAHAHAAIQPRSGDSMLVSQAFLGYAGVVLRQS